ncbi:MAG: hypothetical protein K9G59_00740 [Caulobacter sp.]|nr:hypothetical protein [Caulobacter sp.]
MLALLATTVLAASPMTGDAPERAIIAACLKTDRFAIAAEAARAARENLSSEAWQSECRAAREANARRLSAVRVVLATGRSPVGGYKSTLELVALAKSAADPLLAELFLRTARDQAARESLSWQAKKTFARGLSSTALLLYDGLVSRDAAEADAASRLWLDSVYARRGWFLVSRDGKDADKFAWLIIQHADADRAFQRRAIGWLEPLVATGETSPTRFAYLYDRWAAGAGAPQRYGLQGACSAPGQWTPLPIEDLPGVDARRRTAGLGSTLAEQVTERSSRC